MEKSVIIIGAGPAGITAALELQQQGITDITMLEADTIVGGISRTVNYKGNRIDIGGHRFFSKSDWVMDWWAKIIPEVIDTRPPECRPDASIKERLLTPFQIQPETTSQTAKPSMLVRRRLSRIYFNKKFFNYPLQLNLDTVRKLGLLKILAFGGSYLKSRLLPISNPRSLEEFFVNRFGRKLYLQFFKEYTEKVWGVPCGQISAAWGAQRIKSLSITKTLIHACKTALLGGKNQASQTSLIESFVYPAQGPGQIWELAVEKFVAQGGKLLMEHSATAIELNQHGQVYAVLATDSKQNTYSLNCSHAVSSMPIKMLAPALNKGLSSQARKIAAGLEYRDFITVGLLFNKSDITKNLPDNWIYIQEPGVKVGRIQVFNNWSPKMVKDPDTVWLGLEFFCQEGDNLWTLDDQVLESLAQREVHEIGLTHTEVAQDSVTIRMPKAYPGYFGKDYKNFDLLQSELDAINNLFLVGRNGMHRYNNQDHSMLTAKMAAEQICSGKTDKSKIWEINIDDTYHEDSK